MWTVVFVSQDEGKVKRVVDMLNSGKIMTMTRSARRKENGRETVFEILVPPTELETAQDIICDIEIESGNF